jgi:hypothetical protein
VHLIAAFSNITFTSQPYFYSNTAGLGFFNFSYVPTSSDISSLNDISYLSGLSFGIAVNYGIQPALNYEYFALPSLSNENLVTTLFGPILSASNASPVNDSVETTYSADDTAILRGVLCMKTEFWLNESAPENMTCGIWASQANYTSGVLDTAFQICLGYSTSYDIDPYLLVGQITQFCAVWANYSRGVDMCQSLQWSFLF